MNFTTPIPIPKHSNTIDYNSKIVLLGSCFAENMGEKFEYFKFKNGVNPFGIIFNPVSIEKLIDRTVNQEFFTEKDVFFHNEKWQCFEVHSQLSNENKDKLIDNLNQILVDFYTQIQTATHIIITYGTSWVYRNKLSNEIVANCHKVPQNQFDKKLLLTEIIEKSIQNTINLATKINPKCRFIFTVSPVRHIKDGFVENQVSKAHLLSSIYKVLQVHHFGEKGAYFPSYEIMMDELRDYRFYTAEMLHPNQQAIDYIWIRFFENYINEKEFETMNEVCNIQRSLKHKPFNVNSESHQLFLAKLYEKIKKLPKNIEREFYKPNKL